jgi:hypothetical protein
MEIAMTQSHKKASVFRTALRTAVEGRARHASRFVNGALRMLDDEALKARGIDRKALSGDKSFRALV